MAYRLKKAREEKGMTQEELSIKSNVSRTTISKIESGEEVEVLAGTLQALSKALDVPVSKIFF